MTKTNDLTSQEVRDTYSEIDRIEKALRSAQDATEKRAMNAQLKELARKLKSSQDKMLRGYSTDYIECRDIGHIWRQAEAYIEGQELVRQLTCMRCDCIRTDIIGRFGLLRRRSYEYAEDYHLGDFGPRNNKNFWRGLRYMAAKRD